MKKTLLLTAVLMMLVFYGVAHAQISIEQDTDNSIITITGATGSQKADEDVFIEIIPVDVVDGVVIEKANYELDEDDDIISNFPYVSQQKTSSDKTFTFSFSLTSASGWYAARVNGVYSGIEMSEPFYYANPEEVKGIVDKISDESDIEKIEELIEKNSMIIGFSFKPYFDLPDKEAVCTQIEKNSYETASKLVSDLKQISYYEAISQSDDTAYIESLINDYGEYFEVQKFAGYEIYKDMADKTGFLSRIAGSKITDHASFETAFDSAAILAGVAVAVSPQDVESILQNNGFKKYLNIDFSQYNNLGNKKSTVLLQLKGKHFTSVNELTAAFNTAVSNAGKSYPTYTSGGGSSSGGGGSSSGDSGFISGSAPPSSDTDVSSKPELNVFDDLDTASWAKEDIMSMYRMGAVSGMGENKFEPNGMVTREQFLKMAVEVFDIESGNTVNSFLDVDVSSWYAPYINAGIGSGIIKGITADTFGVGENINREQIAAIIGRILKISDAEYELNFSDKASISDYAYNMVGAMQKIGVINGFEDNEFKPLSNATRAEAVTMIMRAYRYRKGE